MLDPQEEMAPKGTVELLETLELLDPLDLLDPPEMPDPLEELEIEEALELPGKMEPEEPTVNLELREMLAVLENQDVMVLVVPPVLLEEEDRQDPLEDLYQDQQDPLELEGRLVLRGLSGQPDYLEWLELRESRENVEHLELEPKERVVVQDPQDVLEHQEWLEIPSSLTLTSLLSILRRTSTLLVSLV